MDSTKSLNLHACLEVLAGSVFSLTPVWTWFYPVQSTGQTAHFITGSLNSIWPSMVLYPLLFVGTSDGDNQVLLQVLLCHSIRNRFPSWNLRLCRLCLKEGWLIILLSFSAFIADRLSPSDPMSHWLTSQAETGCFVACFKVFPNFNARYFLIPLVCCTGPLLRVHMYIEPNISPNFLLKIWWVLSVAFTTLPHSLVYLICLSNQRLSPRMHLSLTAIVLVYNFLLDPCVLISKTKHTSSIILTFQSISIFMWWTSLIKKASMPPHTT